MLCARFLLQSLFWSLDQSLFWSLKLKVTEIQYRFGDSEICPNFRKRISPLRNGREPIFAAILLPLFISDQAVRLALSNFGEAVSVFQGRHKFNRSIRNGKRHDRIFTAGDSGSEHFSEKFGNSLGISIAREALFKTSLAKYL